MRVSSIRFPSLSKWLFLTSISANANKIISNASLYKDIGPGNDKFLFCRNPLTIISTQKSSILCRKVTITDRIKIGDRHMTAKGAKPAWINWYRASKNRRRSNSTLPPCSFAYVLNAVLAIYLACSFSTAVKPNWDIRYTKLLNFVYGGSWPTNSSTA